MTKNQAKPRYQCDLAFRMANLGQGSAEIVSHLISAGADPSPSDSLGVTAVGYAKLFEKQSVIEALTVKS